MDLSLDTNFASNAGSFNSLNSTVTSTTCPDGSITILNFTLPCNEKMLYTVVKMAFQQRRKTMRNSLKALNLSDNLREDTIFDLRPEQLSVEQFIELTQKIEANAV